MGRWLSRVDCWQLRQGVAESLVTTAARVAAFARLSVRLGSASVALALALAVGSVVLVTVAGLGSVPVAFRLGSVAVRPAVPVAVALLPVVLCKGCPCCPVGAPVSVPHLVGVSFGVGARLGSVCGCRSVAAV